MKPLLPKRHRGFSLVELMVSVAIGLLALLFAVNLMMGSERSRGSQLAGSDSMQNGMLAMFSMSGDAAQAGFGLNDSILNGCDTVFSDSAGYTLAPAARAGATIHPLAPVVIESNGANPDRISFYSGTSVGGTASMELAANYAGGSSVTVAIVPSYLVKQGDVIVVAPEQAGGQCSLAQVANNPAQIGAPPLPQTLSVAQGNNYRFNGGALGANYTAGTARVYALGPASKLAFHSWSVSDGFLRLCATDMACANGTPAPVTDNIVSIKAEYGFDTRSAANFVPGTGMVVSQWSPTMIDADGDGVSGGAGDYGRVAAVRLAVVARSKTPEAPASTGACTTTPTQPVVFATATSAPAVPISVNVAVPQDPTDWRCYHYRVVETIVPLRNLGWRPE